MTRARNIAGFSTITTTPSPIHVGPIGVLTATRIDGEFNVVDTVIRDITAQGIGVTNLQVSGITTGLNVSGIITAQNGINFNGTSTGLNVSGVGTIATLNVTGNATVGGVLTYEDVTRVDSVGVITAREQVHVGTGVSIAAGGLNVTAGISTFGANIEIADKIRHNGDDNTAIRFPAADTFTIETAGSERARVDSSGDFGIGMSPSGVRLDVYSSSAADIARFSGPNSAGLTIRNDTANELQLHTAPSDALIFGTNGENERMRITSAGQLNVGTSGVLKAIINESSISGHQFISQCADNHNGFEIYQQHGSTATRNTLAVYANTGSSGAKQAQLLVRGDGLVGIGTISPLGSLDVRDASGSDPTMFVGHSNADVEGEFLRVGRVDLPAIRYHSIKAKHGGAAASNYISFNVHNAASTTSQSEVLRVLGNGKVGIGTDAPRAGVLHVGSCPATPGSVFSASPMSVFASSNLGTTAGNSNKIAIFGGQTAGNVSGLSLYHYRAADGASWTTDGFSFRQEVDNSSNIYDYLSFKGGKVGINTSVPEEYLDVYHNGVNYNVFGRFCSANGGQAGIKLVAGSGSVNRASRIDFINMNTSSSPQWTLINDYQQTGTNDFGLYHGSEKAIVANPDADVQLMYNGTTRFYTTSTGAYVNGNNGNIFVASCATNSTADVVFQNTEANNAGDMRLLIKTAANQGSDPYIKFDAGGSDMIVGTHYLGTTNNELRLGAGTYVHTVSGLAINGNGNVFANSLNSGSGHSDLRYSTSSKQIFYDSSSRLVKTDIEDLSYGLDTIKQLKPRIYKRTDTDGDIEIGFIADEVVDIIPEIVPKSAKSLFTKNEEDTEIVPSYVEYKRLTAVLTKAVQELSAEVEQLKSQLNN